MDKEIFWLVRLTITNRQMRIFEFVDNDMAPLDLERPVYNTYQYEDGGIEEWCAVNDMECIGKTYTRANSVYYIVKQK